MIISRRTFLGMAAAGTALAGVRVAPARAGQGLFASACATGPGDHRFAGFTAAGTQAFEVALPERGHGAAHRPGSRDIAAFARRPGRFMVIIDTATGTVRRTVEAADGRHFYGHGVYSADGATLYCTENAFDAKQSGVIGVYDAAAGYSRIGEMSSGGLGPHDIRLMADGRTLVVANGGIETHPDMGRAKLNLGTMRPALTLIDRDSATVLDQVAPAAVYHQNSIRHLALGRDGLIVAVLQYEGDPRARPPLLLMYRRGEPPRWLSAPHDVQARMRNYCGSASVDVAGTVAAVSHPRGGLVTFWSLAGQRFLWAAEAPDGCGVAPDGRPGGFVITSGAGGAVTAADGATRPLAGPWLDARRWDNHLMAIV